MGGLKDNTKTLEITDNPQSEGERERERKTLGREMEYETDCLCLYSVILRDFVCPTPCADVNIFSSFFRCAFYFWRQAITSVVDFMLEIIIFISVESRLLFYLQFCSVRRMDCKNVAEKKNL